MKKILLIGAGGHAKSCVDIIESEKKFKIVGFVDNEKKGKILNYKIIGNDALLVSLLKKIKYAFVTVGHLYQPNIRIKIYNKLKKIGFKLPIIKSPFSKISKYASIGEGTIIMHGSIIYPGVKIGKNCILNSQSLIEHDVKIGDFSHLSTNCTINGEVQIGNNCFVGSSSVIKEGLRIRSYSFIKANSLIKKNL
tara:strand:- start:8657 stop:9238 length:582 start_codon:yes stop_codon:yes gene_type:complete